MGERKLIEDYIRVTRTKSLVEIRVCVLGWENSYTPVASWKLLQSLPTDSSEAIIDAEVKKLLNDFRYFRICEECNKRHLSGHMMSGNLCYGCAERNHGVVF